MQGLPGSQHRWVERRDHVTRPRLPIGIDNLSLRRLAVGEANVDIVFERVGDRVVSYLDRRHEGLVPFIVRS